MNRVAELVLEPPPSEQYALACTIASLPRRSVVLSIRQLLEGLPQKSPRGLLQAGRFHRGRAVD